MSFREVCKHLELEIQNSYTDGVSLDEAEKLAGQFLHAQMQTSQELSKLDLDSRMRKTGVKAVRAAIYADIVSKATIKKPTEAAIENEIILNEIVQNEQNALDVAEASRDELERYYQIFREAHTYFRQLARGKFE